MEIVRQNPLINHLYDLRESFSDVKDTFVDYARSTSQFLYAHRKILVDTALVAGTIAMNVGMYLAMYNIELSTPPLSKVISDFVKTENGKLIIDFGQYSSSRLGPFDVLMEKTSGYLGSGITVLVDAVMLREVLRSRKSNPKQKE